MTFEELYDVTNPDEPIKVAEHKDIKDEGQTVAVKEKPESPTTPEEPSTPTKTSDITKNRGQHAICRIIRHDGNFCCWSYLCRI